MSSSYVARVAHVAASSPLVILAAVILFPLLVWRLVRFTIYPYLSPRDPLEYPYWIPIVGHLRSFFRNSNQLISDSSAYFGNSGEPFSLGVAGHTWYIITTPENVMATYKSDNGSLSYDMFAVEVMRMIGVSEDGISKAFQTQSVSTDSSQAKPQKHLVRLCKEYQLEQLSPGGRLEQLTKSSIEMTIERLSLKFISDKRPSYLSSTGPDFVVVQLYQWLSDIFIDIGTQVYFGNCLQKIQPDLNRSFMAFETLSWQAMYQYPNFLCGKMNKAKEKVRCAIEEYFASPEHKRPGASWFIAQIEAEMKRLHIDPHDSSLFFFQLYWSINGNTRKAPFWIISHLLFNAELMDDIRHETRPAIQGGGVDLSYLLDLHTCPRLNSLWDEAVRLTAYAASVRFLTRDVELGGKTLRKGCRLMIPQRQLHFNPEVFGNNASAFKAERFLENPSLRKHPTLRPFGGGATMCPGRNFAKQTTFAFIAKVLDTFHMALDPVNQPFPQAAEGKPSIGLVDVKDGHDVTVKLSSRREGCNEA
ncbi:hypothetical protein PG984_008963 [Apiospora sp. TS-2023a]